MLYTSIQIFLPGVDSELPCREQLVSVLRLELGLTGLVRGMQGGYKFHQYQVVGRHLPTEKEPNPTLYRMKLWATDPVRAKSKFW